MSNDLVASANQAFKKLGSVGSKYEDDSSLGALTVSKADNGNVYVILPFGVSLEHIAHEVYHVVRHAARFIGVDDNEFMAHYVGYLTSKIQRFTKGARK